MRLLPVLAGTLAGLVLAAAGAGTVLVVGIRTRDPRVVRAVNRWQRDTVNPRQLREAPTSGTAVVLHTGRRSGTAYRTPVGAVRHGDALVVLLPYGPGADWVRNVRAAGRATVLLDGAAIEVAGPRVVPVDDVATLLGRSSRAAVRLFGVREALVLPVIGQRSDVDGAGDGSADPAGRSIATTVPDPGPDATDTDPPCARATASTTASPSPDPPLPDERDRSTR